jgi:hypothetical protein
MISAAIVMGAISACTPEQASPFATSGGGDTECSLGDLSSHIPVVDLIEDTLGSDIQEKDGSTVEFGRQIQIASLNSSVLANLPEGTTAQICNEDAYCTPTFPAGDLDLTRGGHFVPFSGNIQIRFQQEGSSCVAYTGFSDSQEEPILDPDRFQTNEGGAPEAASDTIKTGVIFTQPLSLPDATIFTVNEFNSNTGGFETTGLIEMKGRPSMNKLVLDQEWENACFILPDENGMACIPLNGDENAMVTTLFTLPPELKIHHEIAIRFQENSKSFLVVAAGAEVTEREDDIPLEDGGIITVSCQEDGVCEEAVVVLSGANSGLPESNFNADGALKVRYNNSVAVSEEGDVACATYIFPQEEGGTSAIACVNLDGTSISSMFLESVYRAHDGHFRKVGGDSLPGIYDSAGYEEGDGCDNGWVTANIQTGAETMETTGLAPYSDCDHPSGNSVLATDTEGRPFSLTTAQEGGHYLDALDPNGSASLLFERMTLLVDQQESMDVGATGFYLLEAPSDLDGYFTFGEDVAAVGVVAAAES